MARFCMLRAWNPEVCFIKWKTAEPSTEPGSAKVSLVREAELLKSLKTRLVSG